MDSNAYRKNDVKSRDFIRVYSYSSFAEFCCAYIRVPTMTGNNNKMKSSENTFSPIQLVGFEEANSFSIADDVSVNIRELIDLRDKLLSKMRTIRKHLMGIGYSKEDLLKSGYGNNVYVMRSLTSIIDILGIRDPKKCAPG